MDLLIRSYDLMELQRLRVELAARGIDVYMSDEFTYAIPGLPGAEQPRALWVTEPEDLMPARRIVADLVGGERLADAERDGKPVPPAGDRVRGRPRRGPAGVIHLIWGIIVLLIVATLWAEA